MKLGARLPRALAVAAVAAVTVVPLAASAAGAAPVAPTAYTVFGSAQPLVWGAASSLPVGDLRVPFVWGKTNNLAVASANAALSVPDGNPTTPKPMSGDSISGLTCTGYAENFCKDPFTPLAKVTQNNGVNPGHAEQTASFGGKDGHFPGSIHAVTDCPGNCGDQIVHSATNALGPTGGYGGYVTVGSSSASHDLSMDDRGRLVSTATSELDNVSIGPKNEVHFSKLVATAQAIGAGADNTKDGRADLRIADFYILDNPVELTRAGLRLANAGPSEQEAYDGAKVLLKKLKDRGIVLDLPNFDAQLTKTPDHVTVDTQGLVVHFEQSVGSVEASAFSYPLNLGHATAVVIALNTDGKTDVTQNPNGSVTVQSPPPAASAPPPIQPRPTQGSGPSKPGINSGGNPGKSAKPGSGGPRDTVPSSPGGTSSSPPPAVNSGGTPTAPVATGDTPIPAGSATAAPNNPNDVALPSVGDLERNLGLKGARSVSRAFGAFLGLGLILPLSRFLIRRLG